MYPYFISGQFSLFIPEYRSIESEHGPEIDSGTSFLLVQILKKLLYTWRMTSRFNWFYQPNLLMMGVGELSFQDEKIWISILHCTIFLLLQKSSSISSLPFPVRSVWLYSWKSMNNFHITFHFLRCVLQNFKISLLKSFRMFTQENNCVGVSF